MERAGLQSKPEVNGMAYLLKIRDVNSWRLGAIKIDVLVYLEHECIACTGKKYTQQPVVVSF
jgi:hypothetical protein